MYIVNMFKNLVNFSYTRSTKEAFGFYIAYLIITMVLGGVAAQFAGLLVNQNDSFEFGLRIGSAVAILLTFTVTALIMKEKKMFNSFKYIMIGLLSPVLAMFGGALLGFIPTAFLTKK